MAGTSTTSTPTDTSTTTPSRSSSAAPATATTAVASTTLATGTTAIGTGTSTPATTTAVETAATVAAAAAVTAKTTVRTAAATLATTATTAVETAATVAAAAAVTAKTTVRTAAATLATTATTAAPTTTTSTDARLNGDLLGLSHVKFDMSWFSTPDASGMQRQKPTAAAAFTQAPRVTGGEATGTTSTTGTTGGGSGSNRATQVANQNHALKEPDLGDPDAADANRLQLWVPASIAIAFVYALGVALFIRSRRTQRAALSSINLEKPVAGLSELHRRRKLTREVTDAGYEEDDMFVCTFTESPYGRGAGEYAGDNNAAAGEYAEVDGGGEGRQASGPIYSTGSKSRQLRFTSRLGESLSTSGGGRSNSTQSEIESTYDNRAGAIRDARKAEEHAQRLGHRSWSGGSDGTVLYDNKKNLLRDSRGGRQVSTASSASTNYDNTNGVVAEYDGDFHADVDAMSAVYDNKVPEWLNEMIEHGSSAGGGGSVTYDNRRYSKGVYGRLSRMTSDATSARSLPPDVYGRFSRHSSDATTTTPYEYAAPSLLKKTVAAGLPASLSAGIRRVPRSQDLASQSSHGSSGRRRERVPAHPRLRSLLGTVQVGSPVKLELGRGGNNGSVYFNGVDTDGDSDGAEMTAAAALERSPSGRRYSQGASDAEPGLESREAIISRMDSIDSALSAGAAHFGYMKVRGNNAKQSDEAAPTRKQLLAARKVLGQVLMQLQQAKAEVAIANGVGNNTEDPFLPKVV